MQNLNPYPERDFKERFQQTDVYKKLTQDFAIVSFTKFYWYGPDVPLRKATPRQIIGNKRPSFSAVPFYYIDFLLETNPQTVYDLGCGCNPFKPYVNNLIGVGAEDPGSSTYFADMYGYVDDQYVKDHQDYFEAVFSICALHFRPLTDFAAVITDFYSMIRPGGRGFLTFNLQRMIERSPDDMLGRSTEWYDAYCREQLNSLNHIKFLVVDIDLSVVVDDGIDGNVRFVMEKTKQ